MVRQKRKIPSWIKIVVFLFISSLVFTALGAVSEFLIMPLILIGLISFPGTAKDKTADPRLFRVLPWLWILNFGFTLVLISADFLGKDILSPEVPHPSSLELWSTIVLTPLLAWFFMKRRELSFQTLASTFSMATLAILTIDCLDYTTSAKTVKDVFELIGNIASELILLVYVCSVFYRQKKKR